MAAPIIRSNWIPSSQIFTLSSDIEAFIGEKIPIKPITQVLLVEIVKPERNRTGQGKNKLPSR
jgi:hypothetical protein